MFLLLLEALVRAMVDALEQFLSLVAQDVVVVPVGPCLDVNHVDGAADAAAVGFQLEDIAELQLVAGGGGVLRRHKRGSWELMQHARDRRAVKAATAKSQLDNQRLLSRDRQLQLVASTSSSASLVLGIRRQPGLLEPVQVAALHLVEACQAKVRGKASSAFGQRQDRSSALVAQFALNEQRKFLSELVVPLPGGPPSGAQGLLLQRVAACVFQFDETSQKLMPLKSQQSSQKFRQSKAQFSSQVMVLSGAVVVGEFRQSLVATTKVDTHMQHEPWQARSMRLEGTDTNFLIEALLRGLPLDVLDKAALDDFLGRNDVVLFVATLDRASANILLSKWFCHVFWNEMQLGPRITFHNEPCALHGCALVKQRCPTSKQMAAALYSFTRWLRIGKNYTAVTDEVHKLVDNMLEIRDEARPKEERDKAKEFIQVLYGNDMEEHFWVKHKRDGLNHKTSLLLDLESLIDIVDLGTNSNKLVWWNRVSAESTQQLQEGRPVGSRIFTDRKDMVEHVAVPIINFCLGRSWVAATLSRWTNVTITQKRFLATIAISNILVDALQNVKVSWALVGDSIEASLGALVDKDREDFSSRNKLRIIKFMKVLGRCSLSLEIALALICTRPVEVLMYQLLGHNKKRASLGDLSHPTTSIVAACQDVLWKLATVKLEARNPWHLVAFLGVDATAEQFPRSARRHILQVSAGVTQVFELRMASGSGPHRLAWLCYEVVSLEEKRDVVRKLFTYPAECLPFMVFCLRKLYPTEAMFLQKAPATLRVWLESFHSIDFSERAHAQMRTDLSSDGCSKNFAAACNRLVVRQLIASHIDKGGVDVGTAPVAGVLCDENLGNEGSSSARAGLGSSPFIVFHNIRMNTKKQLMAMGRNMTKNEIRQCQAEIKDEWAVIRDNAQEYELWREMSLANRRPIHAGAAGGLPSPIADAHDGSTCRQFKGLWSLSSSPKELIPLPVLANYEASEREKGQTRRDSESKEQASKLIVRGPVPQRKQFVVGGWGSLHGCADGMRNVCLQHGTGALRRRLVENVTQMIRAWVGSLDQESKQDASQLVAFTGKEMTADGHTQTVMALLVLSFGSPVAQMFVNCGFVCPDLPALPRVFHRPACPLRVRILDRLGRMCLPGIGSDRRAFDFQTDVELASDLVSWQDGWDMHTTTYTIC